jgi:hypothetical protein
MADPRGSKTKKSDDTRRNDAGNSPQDRPAGKPRRRRRWLRVILAIVGCMILGLIVLAILLPTVVSSSRGTRYAIGLANSRIRGHLDVRRIDLSWSGPLQLEGVTLLDPEQQEVLAVEKIVVPAGLWQLVRSPMTFGQVDIYQPTTHVYMKENQPPSLVQAVELSESTSQSAAKRPATPTAPRPAAKAPVLRGKLAIHGGSVSVFKPDGQELTINEINTQLSIDTLNDLKADLAAQIASGGKIQVNAHMQGLVDSDGQVNPNNAVAKVTIETPQGVLLDPLLSFADQRGIGGKLAIDVRGSLERGALLADIKTTIDSFYAAQQNASATQPAPAQLRPINLALVGHVEASKERTDARLDLEGAAGSVQTRLAYVPAARPTNVTGQDIIDLLLTGKQIVLPNATVNVQGGLNVAALVDAAPRFIAMRKDVQITSGRIEVQDLAVRTEPQLAASGGIRVADLQATQNGQPVQLEPVSVSWNAHVEPDVGLQVEQGQLQSSFVQADIKGTPKDLQGQFQADLAKLDEQMRQLVDLGNMKMAGGVQGKFQLTRQDPNLVNLSSQITANDLQYSSGEQKLDIRKATISPSGSLVLQNNEPQRAVLNKTQMNMDEKVVLTTAGTYNFGPKDWNAELDVEDAQIPYLLSLARGLGIHALDQYEGCRGQIHLPITASYDPQAGVIASSGDGGIRGLGMNDNTVADELSIKWQKVSYAFGTGLLTLQDASVQATKGDSRFLNFVASNVEFRPGKDMAVRGKVNADAQVQPGLAAAYTLMKKPSPNIAGTLKLASDLQTENQTIGLVGQATIDDLEVGTGQQTVRQEQVRLDYDARVDNQNGSVDIRKAALASAPLSANVSGTIREFQTKQILDINGQYQADWDQVMPIVYELSPGMKEKLALHGKHQDEFKLRGPANDPSAQPVFRGLTVEGLAVGWESGNVCGMALGAAKLEPSLADGVLKLPNTSIPASGGAINLGATVDMTANTPRLHMPGQMRLLDNIDLNGQISKQLLSYVNPLFSDVTEITGKLSVVLQDIDLPMGDAIKQEGTGRGQLFMENVRIAPSGAFGALVRIAMSGQQNKDAQEGEQAGPGGLLKKAVTENPLAKAVQQVPLGKPEEQPGAVDIRIGSPTFEISNGRTNYDHFVMAFPSGVEMVFSGWVGFDDTMTMYVGTPVTSGLLEMAGVKGPTAQYAGVLEGARVDVPIAGTRTSPKLDFSKVDVRPLVEQAVKNLAVKGVKTAVVAAVPGGAVVAAIASGDGKDSGIPGVSAIRSILPGGSPQSQPQSAASQTQPASTQPQQKSGLPGGGILKGLLPGKK